MVTKTSLIFYIKIIEFGWIWMDRYTMNYNFPIPISLQLDVIHFDLFIIMND